MRGVLIFLMLAGMMACSSASRAEVGVPFAKWRASQVVEAFQRAGLDMQIWRYGNKDADDGLAILMVVETKRFRVSKEHVGGVILAFGNEADQLQMYEYYARLGETNPTFSSWLWTRGNVLVQIDRALPFERAQAFQKVLNEMK